ncbi:uncharacterized protein [Amphiura filiformis]|uniref:uncharacterized protein n=1 Tax=Amphiura filiformis TaxID=82378 RepID=UPI003B218F25
MKALDFLRPFGESIDLAWLYSHIGLVWHESGKFKKAERYFTIALRILQRQDKTLIRQESQYTRLSRPIGLRQARILLNRSLSSVLSSLGLLYNHIDNYQKSIECHEEAMEVRKELFGLHPTIGEGYNNLCLVYDRAGQREKALEYAKKGLETKRIFVKQPSNIMLVSLLNVALFTHTIEGDSDKSLDCLNEAYKIRKALGLKQYLTGVIEHYRGDMLMHSERWQEAANSYSEAVHWYRVTEVSSRTITDALHRWGVVLKHLGCYDEAHQRLMESYQISSDLMAEGHSKTKDSKNLEETVKELDDLKRIRIEESRR